MAAAPAAPASTSSTTAAAPCRRARRGPIVLTIHDLQYRTLPASTSTPLKRRYLRVADAPLGAPGRRRRRAERVRPRAPSSRRFGVDPERVVVVPHGVDRAGRASTDADELRAALRPRRPALRRLPGDHPSAQEPPLPARPAGRAVERPRPARSSCSAAAGSPRTTSSAAIDAARARRPRVVRPGRVPDADRDGLIAARRGARVPVASTRASARRCSRRWRSGTPVVCSDRAALPEVVGDAALVRPLDRRRVGGRARRGRRARATSSSPPGARRAALVHDGGVRAPRWPTAYRQRVRGDVTRRHAADRRALPALRARHRADRPGDDAHRRRAGGARPRAARRRRPAVVPPATPSSRAGPAGSSGARRRRGGRSAGPPVPGRRQARPRCAGPPGSPASRLLAGVAGLGAGGWFRRADAVIAMSPPLTLGVTGRLVAWSHRAPLVFNIQDVFPDAAVETGAITNRRVIAAAAWLERLSYRRADAVTVLVRRPRAPTSSASCRPPRRDRAHDPQLRRHRRDPARPTG